MIEQYHHDSDVQVVASATFDHVLAIVCGARLPPNLVDIVRQFVCAPSRSPPPLSGRRRRRLY